MLVVRLSGKRIDKLLRSGKFVFRNMIPDGRCLRRRGCVQSARQRHEREIQAIQVIFQVEDLGEAGAGEQVFAPVAVLALRGQQIVDAGADRFACPARRPPAGRAVPRRSATRSACPCPRGRIVVTAARFAPAAAGLLHILQPGRRAADHRILHVEADAAKPTQHLPGAIDVVDAPAADPGTALLLRLPQEFKGAAYLRMIAAESVMSQCFENAGGDVGAARIEHGVVIGEGNAREDSRG